jgi:hypothetical protein
MIFLHLNLRCPYTGLGTFKPSPITGYKTGRILAASLFMHAMAVTQLFIHTLHSQNPETSHLSKGGGTRVGEQLLAGVGSAVGQRELEVLLKELLDVGAADAVNVGNLDNLQDL